MTTTELTGITDSADRPVTIPLGAFPPELNIPMPDQSSGPVEYADILGKAFRLRDLTRDYENCRRVLLNALANVEIMKTILRQVTRNVWPHRVAPDQPQHSRNT